VSYIPDPHHDAAVELALRLNEEWARKQTAADRLYDGGFYRLQRALGRVGGSTKPCGDPQREEIK
jgi:hypothetical protein